MSRFKIENHWLVEARRVVSPNCNPRPDNWNINLLVIHNISLPPGDYKGDFVERFFTNSLDSNEHPYFKEISGLEVSSHLYIRRNGEIIQFVSFDQRAWHAGKSCFNGEDNCNDFSIGVELEGVDEEPYEAIQYEALLEVCHELMKRYPEINPERICGHCDISPGRKTDPGPAFDWEYFRNRL